MLYYTRRSSPRTDKLFVRAPAEVRNIALQSHPQDRRVEVFTINILLHNGVSGEPADRHPGSRLTKPVYDLTVNAVFCASATRAGLGV